MPDGVDFVLLDDVIGGTATLYREPTEIVTAHSAADVEGALRRVRASLANGCHVAGYLAYPAARAFEPCAVANDQGGGPSLWFGCFARAETIDPAAWLPSPDGGFAAPPRAPIGRDAYCADVARIQALIAAGDIYQANLSFNAAVAVAGDPRALYARLRVASATAWSALVRAGGSWLLSLSPEQFFTVHDGRIEARPMKGTRPRGRDGREDAALAAALAGDAKDRAENLMIVDLLRNDLARVAAPGSVRVPALFEIETFPTLHQMTSRIEARLAPGRDAVDVLAALFPCGSVTGAPKLRAMAVIAEVEAGARGVYTGAIGAFAPDGSAAFNVAIRTLAWEQGEHVATLGLGSAIVTDSVADDEWAECRAKGAFVTEGQRPFDLIETMAFDPMDGIVDLERHFARLKASATALDFTFDRHGARNELHAATFRATCPSRVRLRLARSGALAIEVTPAPLAPEEPVAVTLAPLPVAPDDFRLAHKTSDRAFYDEARAAAGTFELIFVAPDGQVTEGSFTHLFVRRADGMLLTPPLAAGLLPGVLRARLIEEGRAIEARLTPDDLAGGFLIGNALRGLIAARRV